MGKNNKARRAAKARARTRGRSTPPGGSGPTGSAAAGPFTNPFTRASEHPGGGVPPSRWPDLEVAAADGDATRLDALARQLVDGGTSTELAAAERLLLGDVGRLWRRGWQPVEVVRQVRRRTSRAGADLVEIAVHVDHARRAGQAVDPRWLAQVHELGGRQESTSAGWLRRWSQRHGDPVAAVVLVARVLAALGRLPALEVLLPPPGSRPDLRVEGIAADGLADDPVLRRVRKLLAKAESTEFEEESVSLTAKAHELMTRHAIDLATASGPVARDVPGIIRVAIDAPYADAKSLLLQTVAQSHRCRSVFHPGIDLSSVVGHAGDLRAVELVFTSLLVQAQHALGSAAGGAHSRTRSPSYRSAFYVSFARRMGERLAAVTADVLTEAGEGAHLPVLRAREDEVAAAFDERFGATTTSGPVRNGYDTLGHAHGRRAADTARLGSEELGVG